MSTPEEIVNSILNAEADRAWYGIGTVVLLYGARLILRRMFPEGHHFKFMDRFLVDDNDTPNAKRKHKNWRMRGEDDARP